MEYNKLYLGHAVDVLKTFPDECVDCFITSPPYWNLRNYQTNPIVWVVGKDCDHEWADEIKTGQSTPQTKWKKAKEAFSQTTSSFCKKCGAWRGELGAEPTPDLFIQHLCDVFDQVKRVLKPTGTAWINIGDSYGGSGGAGGDYNEGGLREGQPKFHGNNYQPKSLVGIPERLVLEMQNRGWIRRNTCIWHKPNCMPSSANDRFTVDFEYFYFFTKSTKYYFEKQLEPYDGPINRWAGVEIDGTRDSLWDKGTGQTTYRERNLRPNPEGRNKRTTWSVNTEGYKGAHFAVFPRKLVETPIKAGCPEGGVVLDCFAGSGTTCRVAYDLGRKYVGIELNQEFLELAEKRLAQQNFFDLIKEG